MFAVFIPGNTVHARTIENDTSSTTIMNEYDYITSLTHASELELAQLGMTVQDVAELSANYEEALIARAHMPENELYNLGYTQDDITILKKLADGEMLTTAEQRALAGTCTGDIQRISCSTDYAEFKYSWEWDHCPLVTLNDSAAVRWVAFDKYGDPFDVSRCYLAVYIQYYQGDTVYYNGTGTLQPGLEMYAVNIQFEMLHDIGNDGAAYAKTGEIYIDIELEEEVVGNREISYVKVAGLYAHTTVGLDFPTLTISPESIDMSFSGNRSIDYVAPCTVKIGLNGVIEKLS